METTPRISLTGTGIINTPGTKELVENYRALNSAMPSVNVGSGYGAIQVLADAINRAQSLDPGKIRDALAATKNLSTILGTISSFDSTGVAIMPSSIMQWQNMISQVVWPADFASAQFHVSHSSLERKVMAMKRYLIRSKIEKEVFYDSL